MKGTPGQGKEEGLSGAQHKRELWGTLNVRKEITSGCSLMKELDLDFKSVEWWREEEEKREYLLARYLRHIFVLAPGKTIAWALEKE